MAVGRSNDLYGRLAHTWRIPRSRAKLRAISVLYGLRTPTDQEYVVRRTLTKIREEQETLEHWLDLGGES